MMIEVPLSKRTRVLIFLIKSYSVIRVLVFVAGISLVSTAEDKDI